MKKGPGTFVICGLLGLVICASALAGDKTKQKTLTFLDTLNRGKEVSITDADYAPPRPVQPALPASNAVSPPGDTNGVLKPEVKREAGVVPSHFMIQIIASTQQEQVRKEKGNLSGMTELPVTIVFEAPYYKLFVGDFIQRGEAENYLAQVKKLGYNDAWIVRKAIPPR